MHPMNFFEGEGAMGLKVKCYFVEKLMPKQVGNENSKGVVIGYFSLIPQTLICFLVIECFW